MPTLTLRLLREHQLLTLVAISAAMFLSVFIPLNEKEFPTGGDLGNYLAQGLILEGQGPSEELRYPPLAVGVVHLLSASAGQDYPLLFSLLKVLGALLLTSLALSVFFLFRNATQDFSGALVAAATAFFHPLFMEEVAWGGYAQFLGLIASLVAVGLLAYWLNSNEKSSVKRNALIGLLISLTVGFHLLAFAYVSLAVSFMLLLELRRTRSAQVLRGFVSIVLFSALFSAPYIPVYVNISRDVAELPLLLSSWDQVWVEGLVSRFYVQDMKLWSISATLFGALLVGFFLTRRTGLLGGAHGRLLRSVIPSVSASGVIILLMSPAYYADRGFYFLLPSVALLVGFLPRIMGKLRADRVQVARLYALPVLVVLASNAFLSYGHYVGAVDWYNVFDETTLPSFLDIGRISAEDDTILVYAPRPTVWGWWLEGIAERSVLIADEPIWYTYKDQVEGALDARSIVFAQDIIDGGDLRLLLNYGSPSLWSPAIFVHKGQFFNPLSFSDKDTCIVSESLVSELAENPTATDISVLCASTLSLADATKIIRTPVVTTEGPGVKYTYKGGKLGSVVVTKTVRAFSGTGRFSVAFEVVGLDSVGLVPHMLYHPGAMIDRRLTDFYPSSSSARITSRVSRIYALSVSTVTLVVNVTTNGALGPIYPVLSAGQEGVRVEATGEGDSLLLKFDFLVEGHIFDGPRLVTSSELTAERAVDYVYLFGPRVGTELFARMIQRNGFVEVGFWNYSGGLLYFLRYEGGG